MDQPPSRSDRLRTSTLPMKATPRTTRRWVEPPTGGRLKSWKPPRIGAPLSVTAQLSAAITPFPANGGARPANGGRLRRRRGEGAPEQYEEEKGGEAQGRRHHPAGPACCRGGGAALVELGRPPGAGEELVAQGGEVVVRRLQTARPGEQLHLPLLGPALRPDEDQHVAPPPEGEVEGAERGIVAVLETQLQEARRPADEQQLGERLAGLRQVDVDAARPSLPAPVPGADRLDRGLAHQGGRRRGPAQIG